MSDPKAALRSISKSEPSVEWEGLPNIPAVPFTDDASLTNFLQSAKLWMEKAMGAGLTGFATKRDLIRNGLAGADSEGNLVPPSGVPNLAVPPVPTGLQVTGTMTNVIVEWDDPRAAYSNHGYTEIWAAETDDFSSAVLVGESSGFIFAHAVGEDTTRYYWIRFVSSYGVMGPYNGVGGTPGQTAPNPQYLLETLTGQLTESQLYQDLNTRLDKIETTETNVSNLATAQAGLAAQISTVRTTVDGHTTSIQTNATSIDGIQGKYSVKIDNNGYVTGYGLISSANTGTPTSEFMVVADKFSIAPVATSYSASDGSPFFHLTSSTTINGAYVPAGTYMKAAYIHNAAINNAQIADAAIDSAKIANASIVEAKIGTAAVTTAKINDLAVTRVKIQAFNAMSLGSVWMQDGVSSQVTVYHNLGRPVIPVIAWDTPGTSANVLTSIVLVYLDSYSFRFIMYGSVGGVGFTGTVSYGYGYI